MRHLKSDLLPCHGGSKKDNNQFVNIGVRPNIPIATVNPHSGNLHTKSEQPIHGNQSNQQNSSAQITEREMDRSSTSMRMIRDFNQLSYFNNSNQHTISQSQQFYYSHEPVYQTSTRRYNRFVICPSSTPSLHYNNSQSHQYNRLGREYSLIDSSQNIVGVPLLPPPVPPPFLLQIPSLHPDTTISECWPAASSLPQYMICSQYVPVDNLVSNEDTHPKQNRDPSEKPAKDQSDSFLETAPMDQSCASLRTPLIQKSKSGETQFRNQSCGSVRLPIGQSKNFPRFRSRKLLGITQLNEATPSYQRRNTILSEGSELDTTINLNKQELGFNSEESESIDLTQALEGCNSHKDIIAPCSSDQHAESPANINDKKIDLTAYITDSVHSIDDTIVDFNSIDVIGTNISFVDTSDQSKNGYQSYDVRNQSTLTTASNGENGTNEAVCGMPSSITAVQSQNEQSPEEISLDARLTMESVICHIEFCNDIIDGIGRGPYSHAYNASQRRDSNDRFRLGRRSRQTRPLTFTPSPRVRKKRGRPRTTSCHLRKTLFLAQSSERPQKKKTNGDFMKKSQDVERVRNECHTLSRPIQDTLRRVDVSRSSRSGRVEKQNPRQMKVHDRKHENIQKQGQVAEVVEDNLVVKKKKSDTKKEKEKTRRSEHKKYEEIRRDMRDTVVKRIPLREESKDKNVVGKTERRGEQLNVITARTRLRHRAQQLAKVLTEKRRVAGEMSEHYLQEVAGLSPECTICKKKFRNLGVLKRHQLLKNCMYVTPKSKPNDKKKSGSKYRDLEQLPKTHATHTKHGLCAIPAICDDYATNTTQQHTTVINEHDVDSTEPTFHDDPVVTEATSNVQPFATPSTVPDQILPFSDGYRIPKKKEYRESDPDYYPTNTQKRRVEPKHSKQKASTNEMQSYSDSFDTPVKRSRRVLDNGNSKGSSIKRRRRIIESDSEDEIYEPCGLSKKKKMPSVADNLPHCVVRLSPLQNRKKRREESLYCDIEKEQKILKDKDFKDATMINSQSRSVIKRNKKRKAHRPFAGDGPIKKNCCPYCYISCSDTCSADDVKKLIQWHVNHAHKYRCHRCKLFFNSKEKADVHKEAYHVSEKHFCALCNRVFLFRGGYDVHQRSKDHLKLAELQRHTIEVVYTACTVNSKAAIDIAEKFIHENDADPSMVHTELRTACHLQRIQHYYHQNPDLEHLLHRIEDLEKSTEFKKFETECLSPKSMSQGVKSCSAKPSETIDCDILQNVNENQQESAPKKVSLLAWLLDDKETEVNGSDIQNEYDKLLSDIACDVIQDKTINNDQDKAAISAENICPDSSVKTCDIICDNNSENIIQHNSANAFEDNFVKPCATVCENVAQDNSANASNNICEDNFVKTFDMVRDSHSTKLCNLICEDNSITCQNVKTRDMILDDGTNEDISVKVCEDISIRVDDNARKDNSNAVICENKSDKACDIICENSPFNVFDDDTSVKVCDDNFDESNVTSQDRPVINMCDITESKPAGVCNIIHDAIQDDSVMEKKDELTSVNESVLSQFTITENILHSSESIDQCNEIGAADKFHKENDKIINQKEIASTEEVTFTGNLEVHSYSQNASDIFSETARDTVSCIKWLDLGTDCSAAQPSAEEISMYKQHPTNIDCLKTDTLETLPLINQSLVQNVDNILIGDTADKSEVPAFNVDFSKLEDLDVFTPPDKVSEKKCVRFDIKELEGHNVKSEPTEFWDYSLFADNPTRAPNLNDVFLFKKKRNSSGVDTEIVKSEDAEHDVLFEELQNCVPIDDTILSDDGIGYDYI